MAKLSLKDAPHVAKVIKNPKCPNVKNVRMQLPPVVLDFPCNPNQTNRGCVRHMRAACVAIRLAA